MKFRENGKHQGLIITPKELTSGIAPINAENYKNPVSPPVLQLSGQDWPWILKEIKLHSQATLTIKVELTRVGVSNVGAIMKGRNESLPPLIIMTPHSGWWNCASERGGGIACVLEIMEKLSTTTPERTVLFTFNKGHELGHLGLDFFLSNYSSILKKGTIWLHLGANFAATGEKKKKRKKPAMIITQASDKDMENLGVKLMELTEVYPDLIIPPGSPPRRGARNIHELGHRYFSIIGTNPKFHYLDDRWPNVVDIIKTVNVIEAMVLLSIKLSI